MMVMSLLAIGIFLSAGALSDAPVSLLSNIDGGLYVRFLAFFLAGSCILGWKAHEPRGRAGEKLVIPRMPIRIGLLLFNPRKYAEESLVFIDRVLVAIERWDTSHDGAEEWYEQAENRWDALASVGDLLGVVGEECLKHAELRVVYEHVTARYRRFPMC